MTKWSDAYDPRALPTYTFEEVLEFLRTATPDEQIILKELVESENWKYCFYHLQIFYYAFIIARTCAPTTKQ